MGHIAGVSIVAVPASPFCLSSDIAPYLSIRLNSRGDFADGQTNIPKSAVDTFILNISAQILGRFRMAGYVTPLTTDGAVWPDDQTDFLNGLCVMGVASILTSPFVANPGRRKGDGNPFQIQYDISLNDIFHKPDKRRRGIAGPFFGCLYRSMTAAEAAIADMAIPTTSHLLEMNDPARHTGFQHWTDKSQEMQDYMEYLDNLHNYDYELNDLNKGPYV